MKKIQMQGVPETMLQTLYARAAYSKRRKAKFYDDKALEIVSHMDYDFSLGGMSRYVYSGEKSEGNVNRDVIFGCKSFDRCDAEPEAE